MHHIRIAAVLISLFICGASFGAVGDLLGTFPPEDATGIALNTEIGWSLAVSGNTLFVGAPNESGDPGQASGQVYVLDISKPAAVKVLRILTPPNPEKTQEFGYSLAVSGNTLVVGAPAKLGPDADHAGALYVINWRTGALLDTLWPTLETQHVVGMGASVAFCGKILAAGKPFSSSGPTDGCGSVQFFNMRTGDSSTGHSGSVTANAEFGWSLAASSKYVAAGAPNDGTKGLATGSAEIFTTSFNGPSFKLYSPNPNANNFFGAAVAVGGNYLYVSEPAGDFGAKDAGTVYKFNLSNGTLIWGLVNPLPEFKGNSDLFGMSLAATTTLVAVGAPRESDIHAGAVHLYNSKNVLVKTIMNPTPQAGEMFGQSLAIGSSSKVIVGAPQAYRGSAKTGAVYFFSGK